MKLITLNLHASAQEERYLLDNQLTPESVVATNLFYSTPHNKPVGSRRCREIVARFAERIRLECGDDLQVRNWPYRWGGSQWLEFAWIGDEGSVCLTFVIDPEADYSDLEEFQIGDTYFIRDMTDLLCFIAPVQLAVDTPCFQFPCAFFKPRPPPLVRRALARIRQLFSRR
jgi:hypothetical protein